MLRVHLHAGIGLGIGALAASGVADAQTMVPNQSAPQNQSAPSQFTPQTLRPNLAPNAPAIVLPGSSALAPLRGESRLTVLVGRVQVDGAFPDLAPATEKLARELSGQRISVGQIFSAAAALEKLYGEAGYPLVRVVVPPQKLVDHGKLRFAVVDGFIEIVDVAAVPERARAVVARRAASLVGRRHVKLAEIERALLIAGDVPGLRLRSTLERGSQDGGVRLILDGEHRLVSATIGADDRLASSLGTWQSRGVVAINSAFGLGEQVYGTVGFGADLETAAQGRSPLAIYGGGVIAPIGFEGITVNPEYTHSTTRTPQTPGVPASLGTFEREALRFRDPVFLTRQQSLWANISFEEIDQQIAAPDFGATLSEDHYRVFRIGPDYATTLSWGTGVQLGAVVSFGLGGRDRVDATASGIPLSRLGASPDFTKLAGSALFSQPLPFGLRMDLITAGQYTAGKPMLRPEQIALDGNDALSAFAFGTFSADQGLTFRTELSRQFVVRLGDVNATASPYLFGTVGRGWLANATILEQSAFNAGAVGVGIRSSLEAAINRPGAGLALEAARGFTDLAGIRQGWRANLIASASY